jgi:isopenicillin N synthase-like dioxygenase
MKTVRRHLKNHKNPKRVRSPFIHNVNQVEKEIAVLLSAIASPNQTPIKSLDKALKKLVQTTFEIRRQVMEACAQAILLDQIATWKEREMLRIVGDSLDCPIPYLAA